jgi:hypothetical protein
VAGKGTAILLFDNNSSCSTFVRTKVADMKKRTKTILLALLTVLVLIQFIKPERNLSNDNTFAISAKYPVPAEVDKILKDACNDCHSNLTNYPWYANLQPVGWWLTNHVKGGKKHLNYSEFTNRPIAIQNHKFEETVEMVKEGEMPLKSYTWLGLHPEAKLSEEQRQTLTRWAQACMDTLKANYPPDSLVMPKRRPG